jgi:predicted PurR-regulated permease PerM
MGEPSPPNGVVAATSKLVPAALGGALVLVALATLSSVWAPLLFAAWTAALVEPLVVRLERVGARRSLGAAVVVALLVLLLVPMALVVSTLGRAAIELAREVLSSPATRSALRTIVSNGEEPPASTLDGVVSLLQQHGATAWEAARSVAGAGARAALVAIVFVAALFEFSARGPRVRAYLESRVPIPRQAFERLAGAFVETGRGLFIGAGLTALVQALVATVAYVALSVPRPHVLGALTFLCALVPAVGTALVWGPVAVALWLEGHTGRALGMLAIGALGVSSIDNVVRPLLQRWGGQVRLPASALLVGALGGLIAFGPAGLALGPLALRLAREVLDLWSESREAAHRSDEPR